METKNYKNVNKTKWCNYYNKDRLLNYLELICIFYPQQFVNSSASLIASMRVGGVGLGNSISNSMWKTKMSKNQALK